MARKIKHDTYYTIPAYVALNKKSMCEVAKTLGITERTFKEKIKGYFDFSASEGKMLSDILKVPQDQLFLT